MAETGGSRRHQAEERREQILDAAIQVFSEKGFAGASIRDIARRIGVTEGLLYHYFDSKEQLMHACWSERSWRAQMERILEQSAAKPIDEVLRDLIGDFVNTMYENGPMIRLCANEIQTNSELAGSFRQHIEENMQSLIAFLSTRQNAGEIKPGVNLRIIGGLLMGTAHSMVLLFSHLSMEEWRALVSQLVNDGVEIIMNGISPLISPSAEQTVTV